VRPDELRALFPALERIVYLNTATAAPGSRPVLEALRRAQMEWEAGEFSWQGWESEGEVTRELFGGLVGGQAKDVALVSSVAEAAATVAASLPPGKVVVGAREFRSNSWPWLALRDRGFEVVEVPAREEVITSEAIIDTIDDRTVLAAVTEVQSSNGFRVDLPAIGQRCRETGARLFVDLCQSLGALDFDVDATGTDYAVAHGYKWLLAPRGAGWFWVRPDRLGELSPLAPSWKTAEDPYADYFGGPYAPASTARRLDASLAWFSWPGAKAALEMIRSMETQAVEARCLGLSRSFREEGVNRGLVLVPEELPTQIVSVRVEDPGALRRRLLDRKVIGAVRGGSLRLGFHAFNDETDVEAALDALGKGSGG
jgi:selenocysteine lyase/cysteine desulfurase